jgi:hypothetical protein
MLVMEVGEVDELDKLLDAAAYAELVTAES